MKTLNISLPKALIDEADRIAKSQASSRSELIREALRVYLADKQEWKELLDYGKKVGKKMGIKSEKDIEEMVDSLRK